MGEQEYLERKQMERDEAKREEEEEARKKLRRLEAEENEYKEWRRFFSVEERGEDGNDESRKEKIIEYLIKEKVTLLDDLAIVFEMKTKKVVNMLTRFLEEGKITG